MPIIAAMSRKLALCQAQPASGDIRASTSRLIEWMEKAAGTGADIALFGELFLAYYDLENVPSLSESKDGFAAKTIAEAAKRLQIAVIYGYSEIENTSYYNSLMFIDRDGKRLANYRKVHLWPGTEDRHYTAGDVPVVVDWGGLRVGLAICVDVCMSEFVATMVADGHAQLIAVGTALVEHPRYEKSPSVLVPASALQNGCYIAYTDLAGERCSGMSTFCDPHGNSLASTKTTEEALLLATIPAKSCEAIPFLYHSLRRPEVYKIPYDTEVPWEIEETDKVQTFFKNRAHYYDHQLNGMYNAPSIAAHTLADIVSSKNKKVLDIAAGTGLVGKHLFSEGFTDITALDRSEEMLKQSAAKKVYSNLICGSFEVAAKDIPDRSFNACICVGAFLTAGFLDPAVSIVEMVRLVEKGGYILLFVNGTELQEPQCKAVLESLEKTCESVVENGACECVRKSTVPKYLDDCEGLMWILKLRN